MPLLVRSAIGADAPACVEVYRPYVLDTTITFETEPPTVEEMAARIVAAQVMHERLVLEVDGDVAGYAYAHQFNSRAAYQWSVETSVYMAQGRLRLGGGRMGSGRWVLSAGRVEARRVARRHVVAARLGCTRPADSDPPTEIAT